MELILIQEEIFLLILTVLYRHYSLSVFESEINIELRLVHTSLAGWGRLYKARIALTVDKYSRKYGTSLCIKGTTKRK